MSELLILGISHKTAPVEVRERIALTAHGTDQFLRDVHGIADVEEVVVISTCNRTELYMVVDDPVEAESTVLGILARHANIRPTALSGSIYAHRNCEAARHLYRVTSGLDSMILGEDQIQGQVKRAFEGAQQGETVGPLTSHLFRAALSTGKRVRTETAIAEGHLSLPSAAAMLAREQVGADLTGKRVLILGTGETGQLAANPIAAAGATIVFMATRHRDRAAALAQEFHGESADYAQMLDVLADIDIVISATSSEHVLIEAEPLAQLMLARSTRPLLLLDLAVPRDIEPACSRVGGVTLFDIDDLQQVVGRARSVRESEAVHAEGIVEEEIQTFATWLGSLEVLPTIAALRTHATTIAERVVAENSGKWDSASDRDLERVEAIAKAIVNRLLHEPTLQMKEMRDDRVHARMAMIRDLFDLDVNDDDAIEAAPAQAADLALIRQLPQSRH